jgi:hypothetical protein
MNYDNLKLKKFKIKDMVPNATILVLGRRRSGKSWLLRDIFYYQKDIPMGLIFSGTEDANPFFSDFIPDSFIHSEYKPDIVETAISSQSKKIKKAKAKGYENGLAPYNRFFIVLDDMLQDASLWKKERTMKTIFFNGRHYNIFFILTMQYPVGIGPELRSNIDYVFIYNEPSIKNRKKIYDDYGGCIASLEHFNNILDMCTRNFECLVIKTSGNSIELNEQVFWYKAAEHKDFHVGHPKIWEYHKENYNSNYKDERNLNQEEADKYKKKYGQSTRKLKVIVSKEGDIIDEEEMSDD